MVTLEVLIMLPEERSAEEQGRCLPDVKSGPDAPRTRIVLVSDLFPDEPLCAIDEWGNVIGAVGRLPVARNLDPV